MEGLKYPSELPKVLSGGSLSQMERIFGLLEAIFVVWRVNDVNGRPKISIWTGQSAFWRVIISDGEDFWAPEGNFCRLEGKSCKRKA